MCTNTFIYGGAYKLGKTTTDFTLNAVLPPRKGKVPQ